MSTDPLKSCWIASWKGSPFPIWTRASYPFSFLRLTSLGKKKIHHRCHTLVICVSPLLQKKEGTPARLVAVDVPRAPPLYLRDGASSHRIVFRLRTKVFSSGKAAEALAASMAVPILFKPVWAGGRPLIDGAVGDVAGVHGLGRSERVLYHHVSVFMTHLWSSSWKSEH